MRAEPAPEDGWSRYLAGYHDQNPGITEDVLADARDEAGRSPYDWLVEAVPAGAATVVDLACGSGPVGRRLVGAGRVVGVDRSAGELARARALSPAALVVRAGATAVPLAGGVADAVVSSMALMLLAPLESVLDEVSRLLRPGGRFVATVPVRTPGAWSAAGFGQILAALGQARTPYPADLDAGTVGDRFSAAGLTLASDEQAAFARTVRHPADAGTVVRAFYAPGADDAQVAAAVQGLVDQLRSGPVRVEYPIRRLVAARVR